MVSRRRPDPLTAGSLVELGQLLRALLEWLYEKPVKVWEYRAWVDDRPDGDVHLSICADSLVVPGTVRAYENWPNVLAGDIWWDGAVPTTRLGRYDGADWLQRGSGGGGGKTYSAQARIALKKLPKIRKLVRKHHANVAAEEKRRVARVGAINADTEVRALRDQVEASHRQLLAREAFVAARFDERRPEIKQVNINTGRAD